VNSAVPLSKHDQALFHAWHEGFQAADKPVVVNPYAQDASTPRLAANFTLGFNAGRTVHKMKEIV